MVRSGVVIVCLFRFGFEVFMVSFVSRDLNFSVFLS